MLTDRFQRLILLALGIGAGTSFIGAYASYFLDGATGGIIVVLQTLIFLAAFSLPRSTACSPRAVVRARLSSPCHAAAAEPHRLPEERPA